MMVLQVVAPVPDSIGTERKKKEEILSSAGNPSLPPPTCTYQPILPFPQRLAWSKLSQLEPRFA